MSHHRSETFQAQMIAFAMEAMGVNTYSVVGISYGGFVAFRLAHMFHGKVEKVVIVSSGICMTPRDVQGLLDRAHVDSASDLFLPQSPAVLRALMQLSFLKPFPFLPTFVCNDVIQKLYAENREERKELLNSLQIGRQDQEPLPILPQVASNLPYDHTALNKHDSGGGVDIAKLEVASPTFGTEELRGLFTVVGGPLSSYKSTFNNYRTQGNNISHWQPLQ
ncbi:hypothetical protein GOP47_0024282 [Adiantum capillus-veneris]|uniref:AB hydrolase-1 domain-containing protein n=1 Tax=Adiantum capillus-veneris TaxID=13818 RepID=A0A9D4Z5Y6_ADICA|nr:hypothetical protein GOP47_0024282 [Adiantum capillus-veneris]